MIIGIKDVNSTVQITTIFNDPDTGEMTTPDTSIKIRIYPANSDTETVEETDMSVKDSITGFYKYAWDISSVNEGLYIYLIKAVHDSITYGEKGYILVLDTIASVEDIADAVWDEAQSEHTTSGTFGYYLNQKISKAGQGNGGTPVIINIKNTNGQLISGAQCILYSDYAMTEGNEVTAPQYSNSQGQVIFYMSRGTYYLKATKQNETFNNPITITV